MNEQQIAENQKKYFNTGETRPYNFRVRQLSVLEKLLTENESLLCEAVYEDFGKPYFEAWSAEIATVLHEINFHKKHLKGWMKPVPVLNSLFTFPAKNRVQYQPYGTALIIGAWNYPIHLLFQPLAGAISAGNTAVLKPSELSPVVADTIHNLVSQYFNPDYLTVIKGDAETTQKLLKQPFNKIFFTGSTRVGKIVMKAAAENLTPVTLELGGKSPAIIHEDADIKTASKRIWWGKCLNAGQTCVAPDYVMCHSDLIDEFVEETKNTLKDFYADSPIFSEGYTQIVNIHHYRRLLSLLENVEIIHGGISNDDKRMIEPTLVHATEDDEIMQDEIFGPVLPVLTYQSLDDAITYINSKSSPLALYLFTNSSDVEDKITGMIPFGGGCINDTISHLGNPNLPFGGVGNSGFGSYHGKHSFEAFSYKQSIVKKPSWPDPDFRYPPYTESKFKWIKRLLNFK